jgi:ankyrin repeat protein
MLLKYLKDQAITTTIMLDNQYRFNGRHVFHLLIANSDRGLSNLNAELIRQYVTDHHVNIDSIDPFSNQTPLQALINQHSWVATDALFLLSLGANPNTQDINGHSLLHRLCAGSRIAAYKRELM